MRDLQGVDLDNWIEKVRRCQYLQEDELKALCEYVSISHLVCYKLILSLTQNLVLTVCAVDKGDFGRRVKCPACE